MDNDPNNDQSLSWLAMAGITYALYLVMTTPL